MENFNDDIIIEFLSDPEGLTDEEIKEELIGLGIDPEKSQERTINFLEKMEAKLKMEAGKELQKEFDSVTDFAIQNCETADICPALAFRNKTQISGEDEKNIAMDKQKLEMIKKIKRGDI